MYRALLISRPARQKAQPAQSTKRCPRIAIHSPLAGFLRRAGSRPPLPIHLPKAPQPPGFSGRRKSETAPAAQRA